MRVTLLILLTLLFAIQGAAAERPLLRVALRETPPYINAQGDEPGLVLEIFETALRRAGYQLKTSYVPPRRAMHQLETHQVEALLPSHPDEAHGLLYSSPLFQSSIGVIKLKATAPSLIPSGLGHGSFLGPIPALEQPDYWTHAYRESTTQLVDMLSQGRIGYFIGDRNGVAEVLVSKRPRLVGQLEFVEPGLRSLDFHALFASGSERAKAAQKAFEIELSAMKKDGTYAQILKRYGADPVSSDDKTLVIGIVGNEDMKLLQTLSSDFLARHPGVRIHWRVMEENLLRKRIFTSIATRENAFDIIMLGQSESRIYARKGWIAPFDALPKDYRISDIFPDLREALSHAGQIFALPFYREVSLTYARADWLREKNLVLPRQPSFADIKRIAERLHDPEKGRYGICLRGKAGWGENTALASSLAKSFGARWFDKNWQPQLTSPEWKKALQTYIDLVRSYSPPASETRGYQESLALFAEGRCGLWIDASVAGGQLLDPQLSQVSDVSFAEAPRLQRHAPGHWTWSWALAVSESSSKKALAAQFAAWATSENYIRLAASRKGWLHAPPGTRLSTYANARYKSAAPFAPLVESILTSPASATGGSGVQLFEMDIPEFPALGNTVGYQIAGILKGEQTVDQALEEAQREVRRIMYFAGYYRPESSELD